MSGSRRDFIRSSLLGALALPLGAAYHADTRKEVVLAPRLREGATIGLVSPAGAIFDPSRAELVRETLADLGYQSRLGRNALRRRGYLAGSDEARASDLYDMFADDTIDAIVALRGGWGITRMLPHLDMSVIRRNPKIIMGYSDITALLLAIYARTGLVTFHGPVGISSWTPFTIDALRKVIVDAGTPLLKNPAPVDFPVPPDQRVRTIRGGTARGRLAGGNLSVITAMTGSVFLPDWRGHLLFLEDVDEPIYKIDRMLTHLKITGILDAVEGVIWGHCSRCTADDVLESLTLEEVLEDHLAPLNKPVFYGSMIGHIRDKFTVPIGVTAEMDASAGTIRILEPAVQ